MILSDALAISDRRTTRDGYLVAAARAARTGIQLYTGAEVGKPQMDVVRVYRPDTEVFNKDSLGSYAHKPITNDHPAEPVSTKNWRQHAVGHVEGEIARDGEFVRIALMMADADAISALDAGKRELSVGYACELDWTPGTTPAGETYDAVQTNIRVNHVALVDKGRAGSDCRIGDGSHNNHPETKGQGMTLQKVTVDGITVEMSDTAAQVVSKLQAQHGTLVADNLKLIADHAAALKAKDTELAAKDAEIEKLKASQIDDAKLDTLATARADVIGKAKAIVADVKTDGQPIPAIRRAVVAAKLGDTAVKDKSDDYVEARFDLLADAAKGTSGNDPVANALRSGVQTSDARATADKAHDSYTSHLQNAWMGGQKKDAA